MLSSPNVTGWLHRLDSYTNAEFGRALTAATDHQVCVACGGPGPGRDPTGFCQKCLARRRPDHTTLVLFTPMKRRAHSAPTQ